MRSNRRSDNARGIVLSDLHLFARRSQGADCVNALKPDLAAAQLLVLNGDIFDFRWSTLGGLDTTSSAAVDWLRDLLTSLPQCHIHYVLGNHDNVRLFRRRVAALSSVQPRLHFHEHGLRLGSALFLHGDCAHWKMDPARFRRYRAYWDNDRQHGELRARAYIAADNLGITMFSHARWFPRQRTVKRIVYYLDRACPGWRQNISDCYFGHTHLPFSDYQHDGVKFHNTGSAIRGMDFNPIRFAADPERAEPLPASGRHGPAN